MQTKFLVSTSTTYIPLFSLCLQLREEDHEASFLISLKIVDTCLLLPNRTGTPHTVVTNNYFFFSFSFLINFLTCRSYSVFSLLDPSNLSVTFGLNLCFFLHLSSSLSEWLSLPLIHFHYPTPDLHLSSGLPKGPPIKFHADHQRHKSEAQVWQCFFIFSLWIIPHWCRWL